MNPKKNLLIWIAILSCWLFFILENVLDIWFGTKFPGYNWMQESISYLGQSGSPIEHWVEIWGFVFTLLILLFATGFYQTFKQKKWVGAGTIFLIMYALGEGIGSGSFPINPPGTSVTLDAQLHNIFSGIGDTGLVLFPFVLMKIFPKSENGSLYTYLCLVVGIGLLMASFFLIAKYFQPDNFILLYKGLWQRIYVFNYHLMLVVVTFRMMKES